MGRAGLSARPALPRIRSRLPARLLQGQRVSSAFLKALGKDCSGLVNPAIERTHKYESDLGHSRLSDEYRRAQVDEVLRAVKAKRQGKQA